MGMSPIAGHGHDHGGAECWAERATESLAAAGYRRGGARAALISLLDEQRCALSAAEIEDTLRDADAGRPVARASIYRILEELEALKLITRVEVGHGLARFEAARSEGHHHHMVCDGCGDVIPFEDSDLERSIQKLADRVTFTVSEHDVVLHGSCSGCSA
jgi:Fur family ferric uptake transcriptional regulator